ncbi:M48 family metalloprotease [Myroides marinus]|uniref:M48 family metallopeptidase n=1 Tax=Myroides marinus TaxID=703342 RepID=UPI002576680E|nr:M48 family metallopeptidase [Myroides marinus]MDM1372464.1 M48 family metalloprotease [Myroides marinus]MDM1390889.1 M48 family metalloprotease [Myroides marinus]
MNQAVEVSKDFKNSATKAIISIVVFLVFYLAILSLAIYGFTLSLKAAKAIISSKANLYTGALALFIIGFAGALLFFLIKFIFKPNKHDRSHLIEITEQEEPELFAFIQEIVLDINVDFPKKIFLTTEVNAAVFYDSTFLSMFYPVRKNLMIGMGLINTCTRLELKAIIAHEFGHFSQRSMKAGSYVSNVNHMIFNMLYDNDSYNKYMAKVASTHGYITILMYFMEFAIKAIQWVLRILYKIVNKNYLALSKQMEYHADEVAATLVGYKPLETSLYRIELADKAFNTAINIYVNHIKEQTKSSNLFTEQSYILTELAKENSNDFMGTLPIVKEGDIDRFKRSKIEFNDHWNTHPSTLQRIDRLKSLFLLEVEEDETLANTLFKDINQTQKMLTNKLFEDALDNKTQLTTTLEDFKQHYQQYKRDNTFHKYYKHYYDYNNPKIFDLNDALHLNKKVSKDEIYDKKSIEMSLQLAGLHDDQGTLNDVLNNNKELKYLHYNQEKYKRNQFSQLSDKLATDRKELEEQLKLHDIKVYQYFLQLENIQNKKPLLKRYYEDFFSEDSLYDKRMELYQTIVYNLSGLRDGIDLDTARNITNQLSRALIPFISEMKALFELDHNQKDITIDMSKYLDQLDNIKTFLYGDRYNEEGFTALNICLDNYTLLTIKHFFYLKKQVLDYQITLLQEQ